MNAVQKLSEFISELKFDALDDKTIDYCKLLLADYLTASAAGKSVNSFFNEAVSDVILGMEGTEECHTFFCDRKIPVMNAAFLNAVYCHGADVDDGHRGLMGHPGAPVISAVLAMAEKQKKTGKDVILAIVAGYEVCIRLGIAVQPELVNRGFHSTGVVGAVAAAAACGKLLELSSEKMENAMALAMTQAGGLLMVAESGQMSKPINPARAAQSGVLAAMLAAKNVQGSKNSLGSQKGFLHAYSGETDENLVIQNLGIDFMINGSYIKPYPSCRHTHGVINAAEALFNKYKDPEQIESVKVYIYPHAISIAGQIVEPKCIDDAKFSIHYALACALDNGSFGISDLMQYEARLGKVRKLIETIQLISEETLENQETGVRGSRVEICLSDGTIEQVEILLPKGDPEYPFSWGDMTNKVKNTCEGVLDAKSQEQLLEVVRTLDQKNDIMGIMEIMCNTKK